jgi:hypothetical protein
MKEIKCFVLLPIFTPNESIFQSESFEQSIDNPNSLEEFLKNYQQMIEIVEREKGATIVYDAKNIKEFQEFMIELNDEFMSLQGAFYTLLSNAKNFRENSKQMTDCLYFIWNLEQLTAIQMGAIALITNRCHTNYININKLQVKYLKIKNQKALKITKNG